jgi:hypothetical protein
MELWFVNYHNQLEIIAVKYAYGESYAINLLTNDPIGVRDEFVFESRRDAERARKLLKSYKSELLRQVACLVRDL